MSLSQWLKEGGVEGCRFLAGNRERWLHGWMDGGALDCWMSGKAVRGRDGVYQVLASEMTAVMNRHFKGGFSAPALTR